MGAAPTTARSDPPQGEGASAATDEVRRALARLRAGDVEAFAVLVRRYQGEVWRIAQYALGDRASCEDLVQQIFLKVFTHIDALDEARDPGPWIRTVARNEVRRVLRDRQRNDRKGELFRRWVEQAGDTLDDEEALEARHLALRECRDKLPAPAQEALELRYDEGLPFTEIAARIDRSLAGARQLLTRTRLTLRRCIEEALR